STYHATHHAGSCGLSPDRAEMIFGSQTASQNMVNGEVMSPPCPDGPIGEQRLCRGLFPRIDASTGGKVMRPITLGTKGVYVMTVTPAHLANQFKDAILPEVFATPMMVLVLENAALNAIRDFLDAGESAVGTAIDIRHLAATPVGHRVTG